MRISRKWFNQFMDVQDLSIEEMAKRITDAGFEVEGIEHLSQGTNLVIGHVETCTEHPDSDHCTVQLSMLEMKLLILCVVHQTWLQDKM